MSQQKTYNLAFACVFRINVFCGPESEKEMMTGKHVVSDVYCVQCCVLIGWTYLKAHEKDQKYKEGKFIVEKAYLTKVLGGKEQASKKTKKKSAAMLDDSDSSQEISGEDSDSDGFPVRRTLRAS